MSASTGRAARWARGVVVDWTIFVSRGLPDSAERVAEVASDLWEQCAAADRDGRSSPALAAALLLRGTRGAAADLARRREQRAAVDLVRTGLLFRRRSARAKAWTPLTDVTMKQFDQTGGALSTLDSIPSPNTDAEGRIIAGAVAANFFMGGGTI